MAEARDLNFAQDFSQLPAAQRDELKEILSTEVSAWRPMKAWDRLSAEKITAWLSSPKSANDFDQLKYFSLSSYPVESKLKLEKKDCLPELAAAPAKTVPLLGWSQKMLCRVHDRFCPAKVDAAKTATCVPGVEMSLALDLMGDEGVYEEKIGAFKHGDLVGTLRQPDYRKKIWASLERLFSRVPKFRENLVGRLRVVELSDADLTEDKFIRRRNLLTFVENSPAKVTWTCADVDVFYLRWGMKKPPSEEEQCPSLKLNIAQAPLRGTSPSASHSGTRDSDRTPASLTLVELPPSPAIRASTEALLYHRELRQTLEGFLQWLAQRGLLEKTQNHQLYLQATLAVSDGLTSELLAEFQGIVQKQGTEDLRGKAAQTLLGFLKNPARKSQIAVEKIRLIQLQKLWTQFHRATEDLAPSNRLEGDLKSQIESNFELSQALLREMNSRKI